MRLIYATVMAFAAFGPAEAVAGDFRPSAGLVEVGEPVRGVGCYWEFGRMHCSRYCYIEVNGRQYCHSRLRHARPQGPVTIHVAPLYLRSTRQTMK